MVRRVKLYARINEGGSFSRLPVPFDKNGRAILPKPKRGHVTSFAIRSGGKFVHAGEDLVTAVTALRQMQAQIGNGVSEPPKVIPITATVRSNNGRLTIADAVADFISKLKEDVEKGTKGGATLLMYRNAVEAFRDHSGITYMDELTTNPATGAKVLLAHEKWLRKNIVRREGGYFENTLANRFRYLNVFLRANGIKMAKNKNADPHDTGLLDWSDVPREKDITEEEKAKGVRTYSQEDIDAMLAVSNVDEADLIHFALKTGFRDGEISAAEWNDIDWTGKMRRERPKDEPIPNIVTGPKSPSTWIPKGFRTKNKKFRKIEIPSLIERLRARQKRMQDAGVQSTLIFPNGEGRVDHHLVEIVQSVAERAGKKGHEIQGEIGLHRFRKTYASWMLGVSDMPTVQMLLGHADIQTTIRYLEVDRGRAAAGSKLAFSGVGD